MRCGSWGYWLLVLAIVPVVLAVTLIAREYLVRKRGVKMVSSASTCCIHSFNQIYPITRLRTRVKTVKQ